MIALLFLATYFLAYSNGANDNFKGVASLFGSRTSGYRVALWWATVTTGAGSIAAIFLGTFCGIGAVLGLEILDRRVRSASDVAEMLQLPMLGVIPRGQRPGRLSLARRKPALLLE